METLVALMGGLPLWALPVICVMTFVAGFVDAIGGGGGLISLPAYLFCGMPPHLAIGTNKLSSTMGTTVATIKYARSGFMPWKLCIPCVIVALIGSALGARLTLFADETFLMWFMLISLPVVGFYVLSKKELASDKPAFSEGRTMVVASIVAFCVGVYDGFYGPGTGTFLLLLLTGVARLDVYHAAGTTKAINLTTNAAALAVFLTSGVVVIALGILGGIFNIAGNYLGANLFTDKGSKIVRPIILVVLVVFAARIILQFAGVL